MIFFRKARSQLWAMVLALVCLPTITTHVFAGGFLEKIGRQISAPVKALAGGHVAALPAIIVPPGAGAIVDRAANAIGGSVGQVLHNASGNPTAMLNLANVQFLQTVVAIKELRASGIINDRAQCYELASKIASVVKDQNIEPLPANVRAQQAEMTQEVGGAACDTAISANGPAAGISMPSGAAPPPSNQVTGFGGNSFQVHPIAQCIVSRVPPYLDGGPFLIMSDLAAIKWNGQGWVRIGQLYYDYSGLFVLRNGILDLPGLPLSEVGYSPTGQLFLIRSADNMLLAPGPVGMCM